MAAYLVLEGGVLGEGTERRSCTAASGASTESVTWRALASRSPAASSAIRPDSASVSGPKPLASIRRTAVSRSPAATAASASSLARLLTGNQGAAA